MSMVVLKIKVLKIDIMSKRRLLMVIEIVKAFSILCKAMHFEGHVLLMAVNCGIVTSNFSAKQFIVRVEVRFVEVGWEVAEIMVMNVRVVDRLRLEDFLRVCRLELVVKEVQLCTIMVIAAVASVVWLLTLADELGGLMQTRRWLLSNQVLLLLTIFGRTLNIFLVVMFNLI